jgi:hypothetical protein
LQPVLRRFQHSQVLGQLLLVFIPSRRCQRGERLSAHPLGHAFSKDAIQLLGDAHGLLGPGEGLGDAPRAKSNFGVGGGERVARSEVPVEFLCD